MERHLIKDANRPSRGSKKEVAKPLDTESLELVTGDKGQVVTGAEEIKPGDSKRLWGAVFSGRVARKKAGAQGAIAPDTTQKKGAQKSAARPAAKKARRRSEQPS